MNGWKALAMSAPWAAVAVGVAYDTDLTVLIIFAAALVTWAAWGTES